MLGDQAEVDLRDDRVFVADDAGEEFLAAGEHAHEVVVNLPLDGLGLPAAVPELSERGGVLAGRGRFRLDGSHGRDCLLLFLLLPVKNFSRRPAGVTKKNEHFRFQVRPEELPTTRR